MNLKPILGFALSMPLSVLAGVATWLLASSLTGDLDSLGHGIYWKLVYPMMAMSAFALGAIFRRPLWLFWLWGPCIMFTQFFLILSYMEGEANLYPIAFAMYFFLSLPLMAAGFLGWVVGGRIARLRK